MDVIMDGLLIAATLFAGTYCWVLSRRVRALKSLDSGLGAAIVTLTRQIELARGTLDEARSGARETRQDLVQLTARADAASAQLRLLLAAVERRPGPAAEAGLPAPQAEAPAARRREPVGPRLVPDLEEGPPETPEESPAAVPKPRRALSLDGLLRRRTAAPEGGGEPDEAAVVAALTALAAGGER